LDRDGTIIRDTGFVARPEAVALLPGAGDAVRALNDAGICVIVISNQSGIGRGYYGAEDYARVEARVAEALAATAGARLDAVYICPHAPGNDGAPTCECRKPSALLYRRAAAEHALDLARSWCVGDRWRDVEPAGALGARGILVPSSATPPEDVARAHERRIAIEPSLGAAVERILRATRSR
jgi:D-glycero-D-manno-heptose 1,7-bisphosphate phosphatase